MSLSGNVWPGLLVSLQALVGVPPDPTIYPAGWPGKALVAIAEGEQFSVPESPTLWVINETFDRPRFSMADREKTDWGITLRLLAEYSNSAENAEQMLMPLIEQVTVAIMAHIKLGQAISVADSHINGGTWGYVYVNSLWYRNVDMRLVVTEKTSRVVQA